MAMFFCRGCGKEIQETATACPYCGALKPAAPAVEAGRNVFKLIAIATIWTIIIFIVSMVLIGIASGLLNQNDAAAAGQRAGELLALPVLILSIAFSIGFTVKGWLPGARRRKGRGAR